MSLAGLPRSEVLQGAEVDVDPSGEAGGIPGGRGASGAGGRGGGIDDEAGVLLAFFVVGCRLAAFFAGALRAVFLAALLGAAFLAALLRAGIGFPPCSGSRADRDCRWNALITP